MNILRPILHLVVLAIVVFLLYQFVIFPFLTVKAQVVHVIDADSLMVMENGEVKKVQLTGIDAPEGEQCLSLEAKNKVTSAFRESRDVGLEDDDTLGDTDIHGRLLRYVKLSDGRSLNEELLQEGLAWQYKDAEYTQKEAFSSLENAARAEGLGLWSVCNE